MADLAFDLVIDASAVSKRTTQAFAKLPNLLRDTVLVRTINRTGDMARTHLTDQLARHANIKARQARAGVNYSRATPTNLAYDLEVETEFVTGLVFIISRQDEKVCPICVAAEQGGPYTAEQVDQMRHKYHHLEGLLHPNCRCYTIPASIEVNKKLAQTGEITKSVLRVIQHNGPRILKEEMTYALEKLKKDSGL